MILEFIGAILLVGATGGLVLFAIGYTIYELLRSVKEDA